MRTGNRWFLLVLAIATQLPLATLVLRATGSTWAFPLILPASRGAVEQALGTPRIWSAGVTSLALALATGIVATAAGVVIGRGILRSRRGTRRVAAVAAFLPVIAPPVALGVGVQVLFLRVGLGSTWLGVWLAHLVPAVGYVTLYFLGSLSLDDAARDEAARTLGASPWQTWWRVTLPALRRRMTEAMVLGALVSWGQLALTLLVGGGIVRTLPVELLAIIRSGDDHLGAVAALLLTLPPLLALGALRGGAETTGVPT